MGLVDGGVDSGGISVLDGLVAGLVSESDSSEGRDGNEGLKEKNMLNTTWISLSLHFVSTS